MNQIDQRTSLDEQILVCRHEFEGIAERIRQASGGTPVDQIERELFVDLLRLGHRLLGARLAAEAQRDEGVREVVGPDGKRRPYHSDKEIDYRSVFGTVQIRRAYYWREGLEGFCPLDARLNLPELKDSYLLQEWALRMGVEESYDQSRGGLKELLNLEVPKAQLQQMAAEVARGVGAFYDERSVPPAKEEGPILVVQADGKGVPMKKETPAGEPPKRLCKGEKRQKKRMALVGVVYTTDPRPKQDAEPAIYHKEVFANIDRREDFGPELYQHAHPRERAVKRKVFLADGQKSLWDLKKEYLPGFEEVLDWYHATEYLWKAAYLFLPESSPQAHEWVQRQERRFLRGQVKEVVRELQGKMRDETIRGKENKKACERIIGYLRRNRERMRYDRYLRRGLPIGSGAVEGACRHLVKDRMEGSGMRWTRRGAQNILDLRAAFLSGHWKGFWEWYRAAEAERIYGRAAPIQRPLRTRAAG